jgi:cbb3-type cytochrome oxidase subunit 3
MLQSSLIGEWLYRFGLPIIIIVCILLFIGICVYALIKGKINKSEYKQHLAKRMEEQKAKENND